MEGVVYMQDSSYMVINDSTFAQNRADYGSVVFGNNASINANNGTFTDNIANYDCTAVQTHCR